MILMLDTSIWARHDVSL